MQTVLISSKTAVCESCGADIREIKNIKYAGTTVNGPTYREELYECRKCSTKFIIRYEFIEADGHINSRTFSSDVNDPNYNWQEALTEEQKKLVSGHLKTCKLCNDKLSEEMLMDAWFASIIHSRKKKG